MWKHEVAVKFRVRLGPKQRRKHEGQWKLHCKKWGCRYKVKSATMNMAYERGMRHVKRFQERTRQA